MPFKWMPAQANLVALCGETALEFSPALDDGTPADQLVDGRPSSPVRFGTKAADPSVTVRLNFLRNGGFEDEDLGDWTVLSGTSARTTTGSEVATGTAALEFTAAGARYQDILVPSGITINFAAQLRGVGAGSIKVVVVNLDTGRFLNGGVSAPFPWVGDTTVYTMQSGPLSGVYGPVTMDATVEPFATTGRYLTRLRIHLVASDPDTFVDDVTARPHWNFLGIFGHNLAGSGEHQNPGTAFTDYGQVPQFDLDGTDSGWIVPGGGALDSGPGTSSTHQIPAPNTWNTWTTAKVGDLLTVMVASDQYDNYPRVAMGELVIGYVEDLVPALFPMQVRLSEAPAQVRNETAAGDVYVYNPGPNALREVGLRFIFHTAEAQEILRDRLYRVSRGGADGIILVPPDELVSHVGCVFGLPAADFDMAIEAPTTGPTLIRTVGLTIRELPSPEASAD